MTKKIDLKKLINECVEEELLAEGLRSMNSVKICGGREVPYGSKEHLQDLHRTLEGIEVVRGHWARYSVPSHVMTNACGRLRGLIKKILALNSIENEND